MATALKADKLVFLSDTRGITADSQGVCSRMP